MDLDRRIDPALAARYRAAGWWGDRSLADGLEAAAATRPDALATADARTRLTWTGLLDRVHATLGRLQRLGSAPGDPVVLIAGNTVAGVVAVLALQRAGAVVVTLDPRCGAADVALARELVGPSALVVLPTAETDRLLGGGEARTVDLDQLTGPGDGTRTAWTEPDRESPCLVLFTSGTTNRPKGVIHCLETMAAGARNLAQMSSITADDVVFLVSPLTSIAGLCQLTMAVDHHAALVVEDDFDPDASLDRANAVGATFVSGAPVITERLLRAATARAEPHVTLRIAALGGAMVPRPLIETAIDRFGIALVRVYGSSEMPCATGSAPADDRARRLADDGVLMPGTEVRVGTRNHDQEGALRGPALFLGYTDPEDHAAAFDDTWFCTGDLLEVHDGRLTVTGRIKDVVNRNGLKISCSEIECVLAGMPGVVEAACFAVPDVETGERLAVAVVPEPGAEITLAAVHERLLAAGTARRKLPEQLATWDALLPRTPSGKVVRAQLTLDAATRPGEVVERLRG